MAKSAKGLTLKFRGSRMYYVEITPKQAVDMIEMWKEGGPAEPRKGCRRLLEIPDDSLTFYVEPAGDPETEARMCSAAHGAWLSAKTPAKKHARRPSITLSGYGVSVDWDSCESDGVSGAVSLPPVPWAALGEAAAGKTRKAKA